MKVELWDWGQNANAKLHQNGGPFPRSRVVIRMFVVGVVVVSVKVERRGFGPAILSKKKGNFKPCSTQDKCCSSKRLWGGRRYAKALVEVT